MEIEIEYIVKLLGMILVGMSVYSMNIIGIWFIIPWVISWLIYDSHTYFAEVVKK